MRVLFAILALFPALLLSQPAFAGYPNGSSGNSLPGYTGWEKVGGPFTGSGATWRIPSATFDPAVVGTQDLMFQWTGVDSQSHLVQTGVREIVQSDGSVALAAWWECTPAALVTFGNTPQIGDVITASMTCTANCTISNAGQTWTAVLQDVTQGWTATQANITCATGLQIVYPFVIETNAGSNSNGSIVHFSDIPVLNMTINGANANLGTGNELFGFAHGGGPSTATQNPSDPTGTNDHGKICWGLGDTSQTGTTGYTDCLDTPSLSNNPGGAGFR